MVLPFLVLIALGLVEMGLGWMSATDVTAASRDGARAGSSAPAAITADHSALVTVASGLSPANLDGLQRVVIYDATAAPHTAPSACQTAPLSGDKGGPADGTYAMGSGTLKCNIYGPKLLKWISENPGSSAGFGGITGGSNPSCVGTSLDSKWCPVRRKRSLALNNQVYLGVYVEVKHKSVTNFGFGDRDIKRTAVFRLEPSYGGK